MLVMFHAKLVSIMHSRRTFLNPVEITLYINVNHLVKSINVEHKASKSPQLLFMGMLFCVYDCNPQSTGLQSHHFRNLEMFWHLLQGLQYPCLQQRCELNSNRPKATQTIWWHSTHTSWPSVGTSQLFSSNFLRLMWMENQSDLLDSVNVLNLQLMHSYRTLGSWKVKVDKIGKGGRELSWAKT